MRKAYKITLCRFAFGSYHNNCCSTAPLSRYGNGELARNKESSLSLYPTISDALSLDYNNYNPFIMLSRYSDDDMTDECLHYSAYDMTKLSSYS